jgi:biopolymer transport protein ExbD
MRLKQPPRPGAIIPTASMADIAFLLIIFFMVTTSHEVDRTSVNLPLARTRIEAEKGAAIVVLNKVTDPDTNTEFLEYKFSDGKEMSHSVTGPEDIYLECSRIIHRDETKQFALKSDGTVRFELVDELLDQMREGGVQNVLLLSQQNTARDGGS